MTPPINQLGRSGITRKIIMLVMISGFLPLLVLATIFFVFAYKSEKQFVYDIQKEMCNRVAVSISAHLNTTFGQIKLFANSLKPKWVAQRGDQGGGLPAFGSSD